MDTKIQAAKTELRNRIRVQLREMPHSERSAASARVCELLKSQAVWKSARAVLFFAPLPDEVDVWPLISVALAAGKMAALPYFVPESGDYAARQIRDANREFKSGQFGIREPGEDCPSMAMDLFDLVLVPGIAFDLHGHRLGRGRGFYDRLLPEVPGVACGVAFDQQLLGQLPTASHDASVDCVLTPAHWIEPMPARPPKS